MESPKSPLANNWHAYPDFYPKLSDFFEKNPNAPVLRDSKHNLVVPGFYHNGSSKYFSHPVRFNPLNDSFLVSFETNHVDFSETSFNSGSNFSMYSRIPETDLYLSSLGNLANSLADNHGSTFDGMDTNISAPFRGFLELLIDSDDFDKSDELLSRVIDGSDILANSYIPSSADFTFHNPSNSLFYYSPIGKFASAVVNYVLVAKTLNDFGALDEIHKQSQSYGFPYGIFPSSHFSNDVENGINQILDSVKSSSPNLSPLISS